MAYTVEGCELPHNLWGHCRTAKAHAAMLVCVTSLECSLIRETLLFTVISMVTLPSKVNAVKLGFNLKNEPTHAKSGHSGSAQEQKNKKGEPSPPASKLRWDQGPSETPCNRIPTATRPSVQLHCASAVLACREEQSELKHNTIGRNGTG